MIGKLNWQGGELWKSQMDCWINKEKIVHSKVARKVIKLYLELSWSPSQSMYIKTNTFNSFSTHAFFTEFRGHYTARLGKQRRGHNITVVNYRGLHGPRMKMVFASVPQGAITLDDLLCQRSVSGRISSPSEPENFTMEIDRPTPQTAQENRLASTRRI